jgi:hypothetical protein
MRGFARITRAPQLQGWHLGLVYLLLKCGISFCAAGRRVSANDMPRTLYCRLCAAAYASVAGDQPAECPACGQAAHWSTEPQARREYVLSENDRRFLKSLRIGAE